MVTKPSRGSLIRLSSISATITWIRSAILRTRGLLMVPTLSDAESAHLARQETPSRRQLPAELTATSADSALTASAAGDLSHLERLDDVALPDVLEVAQHQTTLEALTDLGRVVLLPLERGQVEVVGDHGAVPEDPHLGVATDDPAGDHAARDVADLRRAEDRTDLRLAEGRLLVLRLEHALEGRLDLLDGLVDDRVVPDLHAFLLRHLGRLALGPDVEADDDGVGGRGQVDVGLGDRTDTAVDDADADLVADVDLRQGVLESLDRAGHIALEDEVELLARTLLHGGHEVLERTTHAALGLHGRPLARLALLGDLTRHPVVLDHDERLTRTRDRGETEDHRGARRVGLGDVVTVLVEHR